MKADFVKLLMEEHKQLKNFQAAVRVCNTCRLEKPVKQFSTLSPYSALPNYICRECIKQRKNPPNQTSV